VTSPDRSAHSPLPPSPVLLTSLASAALMDGNGDLEYGRETRGTPMEWGGVYGQLVRLTSAWRLALVEEGIARGLPETRLDSTSSGTLFRSRHRAGHVSVDQLVVPSETPPGVVRRLRLTVPSGPPIKVIVESRFAPYLLPVLVEGIRPVSFRVQTLPEELRVRQRGFGLRLRTSVPPDRLVLNRASWLGGRFEGSVEEVGSDHELTVAPGRPTDLSLLIAGGLERDLDRGPDGSALLADPELVAHRAVETEAAWIEDTPELCFPDSPEIEAAYSLARTSLYRLYSAPGEGLVGLVAGYPWYSAIWCRDLAWMLPAVLWLGDIDWAARAVASVLRFQSRSEVPVLGGEPGELPMQFAPGPLFFYGTSDTTLYFPGILERLVRHSGRTDLVPESSNALDRILAWGRARCDPNTGLLRNGGEAESMSAATGSLAHVRYGIDSPDTTIWDSADRRDHAVDIQALWYDALRAAARLLEGGPAATSVDALRHEAEELAATIRSRYDWSEESYLYDSLRNGSPVQKLRPNALRAVSLGVIDRDRARAIVARAGREDLSTPWGVRTLSRTDPTYDPGIYHEGQVWTIATAWAADAAFAVGEPARGLEYLRTIAARYREEGGFANECYRGDRPEPFNSCFLLGFSVAPFLTVLFERLWGLDLDARIPRLVVRPSFPPGWSSATLDRLRIGPGRARIAWRPSRMQVRWTGPSPLTISTSAGESHVAPASSVDIELEPSGPGDPPR
jgi:hypothetical protein